MFFVIKTEEVVINNDQENIIYNGNGCHCKHVNCGDGNKNKSIHTTIDNQEFLIQTRFSNFMSKRVLCRIYTTSSKAFYLIQFPTTTILRYKIDVFKPREERLISLNFA